MTSHCIEDKVSVLIYVLELIKNFKIYTCFISTCTIKCSLIANLSSGDRETEILLQLFPGIK